MTGALPDDPNGVVESVDRTRRERAAVDVARRWVTADPFYEGKPINEREEALMRLVLRCYTHPTRTDIALVALETERGLTS